MGRSTPWGAAQQVISHTRGFSTVFTASHGGMMVSRGAAEKHLSEAARKRALKHGDYYCYEEDCDYLIPLFDAKEMRKQLMSDSSFWESKTEEEIESYLIESLSDWHPDYLIEKGVDPAELPYKKWLLRKERDEAEARKDPNLVICAFGDHMTLINGVIKLLTADGKEHYVTSSSYDQAKTDPLSSIYSTLDSMEVIEQNGLAPMEDRLMQYALDISKPYLNQIEDQTEAAVQEAEGKFYGPRSRFNGCLESAKDGLNRFLFEVRGLSWKDADMITRQKLAEVFLAVDEELKSCRVFQNNRLEVAA